MNESAGVLLVRGKSEFWRADSDHNDWLLSALFLPWSMQLLKGSVNIDSGNGMVPEGTEPLPEPVLTKITNVPPSHYRQWMNPWLAYPWIQINHSFQLAGEESKQSCVIGWQVKHCGSTPCGAKAWGPKAICTTSLHMSILNAYLAKCYLSIATWMVYTCRADSRLAPSQWKTSLQSNTVSHWLGANLESVLKYSLHFT